MTIASNDTLCILKMSRPEIFATEGGQISGGVPGAWRSFNDLYATVGDHVHHDRGFTRCPMTNSPEFDAKCGKCAKSVKMCIFGGVTFRTPKKCHFLHPPKSTPQKRRILGKTPKMRFLQNPSRGAQKCGESRQIIYCLDTRSGPQNGGISRPPQMGGFWGVPAKHVFCAFRAKHAFCTPPQTRGEISR